MESFVKVGDSATHKSLGNCVVIRVFPKSGTAWIQVWGGPTGDKLMLFKGQRIEDIKRGHNQSW